MKHNGPRIAEEIIERSGSLDEIMSFDKNMSERIAVLLDENEKLRRIALDLSSHNRRMRNSGAETN